MQRWLKNRLEKEVKEKRMIPEIQEVSEEEGRR